MRDPSCSSLLTPQESDYGRVVGIVVLNDQLSLPHTATTSTYSSTQSTQGIGPRLGFHIEFGYSYDDLTLMHTIDVYGAGGARTVVWDVHDVLK